MSESRNEIVREFWMSRYSQDASNFTVQLFRLIAKADPRNRDRIAMGYPDHVSVYAEWEHSPTEDAFFEVYGLSGKPTR